MGKVIGGVVALALIVIVGAGVYVMQNIDGIVKELIEEVGTEVTGTGVSVADLKLNLAEGSASISGIAIANPPGFSNEKFFTMDNIKVAIDVASLSGPVYVINEISVDGVQIIAEQKGTGTNVQALMDGMNSGSGGGASGSESTGSAEIQMAVNAINFSNGGIDLRSDTIGNHQLELPNLNLRNLGSADGGLTPDELGQEIAGQLVGQVQQAVSQAVQKYLAEEGKKKLTEKLGGKLGSLFGKDD